MTIKQQGGIFGRNPTFNDVTVSNDLTVANDLTVSNELTVSSKLNSSGEFFVNTTSYSPGSTTSQMYIPSSGTLYTNGGSSQNNAIFDKPSGGGNTAYFVFRSGFATNGSITTNGTSTSYNTASDYRLKENVVTLTGAVDRIKQIPVHRFNFITNPNATVDGFLAHEVQDVIPEAVHGAKDAVDADGNIIAQGIDQSKLVPLLLAALQDAIARIEALEST